VSVEALTARITVVKQLIPADDPGRFDLSILAVRSGSDPLVIAEVEDVGDGGTLGPVSVSAAPLANQYLLRESMPGGRTGDYAASLECVEDEAGGENPASPDSDGQLAVAPGDDWTCTITNERALARITVVKQLIPADDPGRFDLILTRVDTGGGGGFDTEVARLDDVGDGGTLGPLAVSAKPGENVYRIREQISGSGIPDYAVSLLCEEDPAGGESPLSPFTDLVAPLIVAHGDDWTCTITNERLNHPPVALDDGAGVAQDSGPTAIDVLANDVDPDDDPLTISAATQGAHGIVTITGGGSGLTYDPVQGFAGLDSFEYTVADGKGGTDTATVTVTVSPIVAPPVTQLTLGAPSGSTVLEVLETGGFLGRVVRIGVGATAEKNFVKGLGSLLLARPLRFNHAAGEPVVALEDTLFVSVDRATIDFRQKPGSDLARFSGTFALAGGAAAGCGENVAFSLDGGVFAQLVPGSLFDRRRGCVYRRPRSAPGGIELIKLDFATGTWTVELKGVDLDALTNPVDVTLSIGGDQGSESLLMRRQPNRWDYRR
jgi:hypothetical protein